MAKDNEVLEKIMTIVSDRATVAGPAASGGAVGASEAAASFLSGLGGADDHASVRSSRDRCESAHRIGYLSLHRRGSLYLHAADFSVTILIMANLSRSTLPA